MTDEERKPRPVIIQAPKLPVSQLAHAERNKAPRTTKSAVAEEVLK